jgi:hypothetical protein
VRNVVTYMGENIYRNTEAGSPRLRWTSGRLASDTLEGMKSLIRQARGPVFTNAKGRLTPYALACGYVEKRFLKGFTDATVTLWHEGGPGFHIRAHDSETGVRLFWETAATIGEARAIFDRAERIIAKGAQA